MLLLILAVTVGASLFAMKRPQILEKLMLVPYNVNHFKEYYRIVSHGFIHADGTHLFFNMFVNKGVLSSQKDSRALLMSQI